MRATFKLLNSYFWKTLYGPILAFIFPSFLLAILGNIMRIEYVFPGIVAMTTLFIAIQSMPLGLMEVKNSTLFKYIGSTPVNPKRFILSTLLFYVFIIFIAIGLLMVMGAFIFYKKVMLTNTHEGLYSGLATSVGFFSFIIANALHVILSLAVGITIATLSKTPQQALTISLIVIIPSMFLSGMVLSVDIIAQSSAMQWISRLVPFRYTTGNIVVSMTMENQIGNLMDVLSLDNKRLIFNIVGIETSPGSVRWLKGQQTDGLILATNGHSLIKAADLPLTLITPTKETINGNTYQVSHYNPEDFNKVKQFNVEDIVYSYNSWIIGPNKKGTFDTWFNSGDSTLFKKIFIEDGGATSADNNMFLWTQAFGVRKIPDMNKIRDFIQTFFIGESKDPTRFIYIWNNFIQKNNYNFLNLFMKQNVVLYSLAERILNTLLPLTITTGLILISNKNFQWSAR